MNQQTTLKKFYLLNRVYGVGEYQRVGETIVIETTGNVSHVAGSKEPYFEYRYPKNGKWDYGWNQESNPHLTPGDKPADWLEDSISDPAAQALQAIIRELNFLRTVAIGDELQNELERIRMMISMDQRIAVILEE